MKGFIVSLPYLTQVNSFFKYALIIGFFSLAYANPSFAAMAVTTPPPPANTSCSSVNNNTTLQCDGTNDATCAKACSISIPIPSYLTSQGTVDESENNQNLYNYNQYDISCPKGYSLLGTRFISGVRPTSTVTVNTLYQLGTLRGQGYICGPDYAFGVQDFGWVPANQVSWTSGSTYGIHGTFAPGTLLEVTNYLFWGFNIVTQITSATIVANCYHGAVQCNADGTGAGAWKHSGVCDSIEAPGTTTCYYNQPLSYQVKGYWVKCTSPKQLPQYSFFDPFSSPPLQMGVCGYTRSSYTPGTAVIRTNAPTSPACSGPTSGAVDSKSVCAPPVTPRKLDSTLDSTPQY